MKSSIMIQNMSSSIYKITFLSLMLMVVLSGSAVDKKVDKKKEAKVFVPLYNGIQIGFELSQPAGYLLSNSWGYSANIDVNLKNKYFPTFEVGYSDFNKESDAGIHCTATGNYFKAGLNIPVSIHGTKAENMFYAGLHYGFSAFSYDLDNLTFSGGYWGDPGITSFTNEKAVVGWVEADVGIRVNIIGPFSLGWNVQYKSVLNIKNGDHSIPPYIPGYGANSKPGVGVNAHLYYKLPF
jgi:hypothetical protein